MEGSITDTYCRLDSSNIWTTTHIDWKIDNIVQGTRLIMSYIRDLTGVLMATKMLQNTEMQRPI